MWELDHKESQAPKNWCFWTVGKEIKPVHPKGNQSWIFIGRTDAEAETPKLWPTDEKNWLIGKDPDAGKDWRQEKKGTAEDKMVGWYHWLNGHEFEQALGVGDGQGSLACCSPWGHKELDTTKCLNWTEMWEKETRNEKMKTQFFSPRWTLSLGSTSCLGSFQLSPWQQVEDTRKSWR